MRRSFAITDLTGLMAWSSIPSFRRAISRSSTHGQQHFHAVSVWGGEADTRCRNVLQIKASVCAKRRGVELVAVDDTEPPTQEHVESRLRRPQVQNVQ
jgi:hypothetical protein